MLRTAQQRKEFCKDCPVARVADLLGDSCSLLIVRDLLVRPRRFSEIEESLKGISTRTLSNKLKILEKEGIISKKTAAMKGHRSEYRLTKNGLAFNGVVEAMRVYGKKYL